MTKKQRGREWRRLCSTPFDPERRSPLEEEKEEEEEEEDEEEEEQEEEESPLCFLFDSGQRGEGG